MKGNAGHLSEDELEDVLIGMGSAEADAHVAGCAACAGRKAEFAAAVAGFNQATLAWSEAKSHTLTRDLTAGTEGAGARRFGLAAAAGVCGAAVVAALLSHEVPRAGETPGGTAAPAAAVDRDREIAGDDAMLRDIDAALYRPDPSPEQVYRLDRGTARRVAVSEVRE